MRQYVAQCSDGAKCPRIEGETRIKVEVRGPSITRAKPECMGGTPPMSLFEDNTGVKLIIII